MGTLFLISTPIGNLEDISYRGVKVLKRVRLIAAEDTRRTKTLLDHYQIETPLTSYHEHNKLVKIDLILEELQKGDVGLVSDAGTPLLNDPGYELVHEVLNTGHTISPIPGASALLSALVCSDLPPDKFLYLGYLPKRKKARKDFIQLIREYPFTLVILETPYRLVDSLVDMNEGLGDRKCSVGREMTKLHEEFFRGDLQSAMEYFSAHNPRGEITIVVDGFSPDSEIWTETRVRDYMNKMLEQGNSAKQTSRQVSELSGWSKKELYELIHDLDLKEKS